MLPKWKAFLIVYGGALIVGVLGYMLGHSNGVADGKSATRDSVIKATETRIIKREPEVKQKVQEAQHFQQAAAAKIDTFHKHVVIIDSTHVSIDGGPPVTEVPVSMVVPPLNLCETMLTHDTAAMTVLVAQLKDMTTDRDEWKAKAEAGHHFLGFKAGVIVGGAAAYTVTHPAQVIKAAKWLIGVL